MPNPLRPQIYQLMVRHFGNTNPTQKRHGSIEENGCGKFNDINDAAIASIKDLGITHIWLTGILEQASGTAYPDRPADSPLILKGKAGSPYAVKDYFDVCPDYAEIPNARISEFKLLLKRIKKHGLKTIIDFIPNHVARSYSSDVCPELSFGNSDDTTKFFDPNNNFYYLQDIHPGGGAPLKLPKPAGLAIYPPESKIGKVTGNNAITWSPSINDWYETIKLNYGHDFTIGATRDDIHPLPSADALLDETPDTWQKMDCILNYWQDMGVDGFRVDMAHMIPTAYWNWQLQRCRKNYPKSLFMAEAYDGDPAKLTEGDVLAELIDAGFDAVYDSPPYDTIKETVEGVKWANDIDDSLDIFSNRFHHLVRYTENHDEVRIASSKHWAKSKNPEQAMLTGRAVSAVLYGLSRGPIILYNGQEIGEPAKGAEGFSGNDGKSSIFDYGALPELSKWVNGHKYDGGQLSLPQQRLRSFYRKILHTIQQPAFTRGDFYGLNHANLENPYYSRAKGEDVSGRWLYSFLRRDEKSGQAFLVVANLNPEEAYEDSTIKFPSYALDWIYGDQAKPKNLSFTEQLDSGEQTYVTLEKLIKDGFLLSSIPASYAFYFEIE